MMSRETLSRIAIGTTLVTGPIAGADVQPDWIAQIASGNALDSGLRAFTVDATGNSYVASTTGDGNNTNVLVASYDPAGALRWSYEFDGPAQWHDQARGIALGRDGELYVCGNTPDPLSYAKPLLLKFDAASGALLNTVIYSSGDFTSEFAQSVAVDDNGNVYLAGGTVGDGGDAMTLSFTASGDFRWRQVWDGPAFAPYSQDSAWEVLIAPDGNPVVNIYGVSAYMHGDYVVAKYSSATGDPLWISSWGVPGEDGSSDMELDANGDVYVTGVGLDGIDKFSTLKLNGADGSFAWHAYDAIGTRNYAFALEIDNAGGVYVTGRVDPDGDRSNANDNFLTVKRDATDGSLIWSAAYGANCLRCFDEPSDVRVDPEGNLFVMGVTSSPPYVNQVIMFVLDAATGLEVDRGIMEPGLGAGVLEFDARFSVFDGSSVLDFNSGDVLVAVGKFPSRLAAQYRVDVSDLIAGQAARFTVSNATPLAAQYIVYSLSGQGSTPVPPLNVVLDLARPSLLESGRADDLGAWSVVRRVPTHAAGRDVWFQCAERGRTTPPVWGRVQ